MQFVRAIKMQIYPNAIQQQKINCTLDSVRYVYNHMLERQQKIYKRRGEHMSRYDMQGLLPVMKQYLPWLKESDSQALQYVCKQLNDAYQNFFQHRAGFPKFKSKKAHKQSYTTTHAATIKYMPHNVKLPCLGVMPCSDSRELPSDAKICYATVSRICDTYFVSITYKYEEEVTPTTVHESQVLGLDYKSTGLYCDSNGVTADMPQCFKKSQKKLRRAQRKLSRRRGSNKNEKQSNRWKKQHKKVNAIYEYAANQRLNELHVRSKQLAADYDAVCVETLDMQQIAADKRFSKAVMDNGYNMFLNMLDYKLQAQGKQLIRINKWFPSSQLCSCCGTKNLQVKDPIVRKWTCPACGTVHDRDVNAAINIRNEGLKHLIPA